MNGQRPNHARHLVVAAVAAFCTYFCMYAFRKPFAAGTYDDQAISGVALKTVLVISQLLGYMLSKFIGIKVVSEMPSRRRGPTILGLIVFAELALVGFAFVPVPVKVVMLFFNGLPLGMVFGLVLAYLEGRKHTEALSAVLCASFIIASGVVKSVGRWLIDEQGLSEFSMPMVTGLIFFVPLVVSVLILQATPPPDADDMRLRTERKPMSRRDRIHFFRSYWPGLTLFLFVYVALTVTRTIRDDFGVEIWRDMGVDKKPEIFAQSETLVAIGVTALNALAIMIRRNLTAIRVTVFLICVAFCLVAASTFFQPTHMISPFAFMVMCGIGLYVPYVAFHTTLFERVIAASRHPSNLGFLMYLADAVGYLGYAVVMVVRNTHDDSAVVLPFFRGTLIIVAGSSIIALVAATFYFHRVLKHEEVSEFGLSPTGELEPLPQIE